MSDTSNFLDGKTAPTPPAPAPNTTPDSQQPQIQYPEGFDETLKGHSSLTPFIQDGKINQANLMKSFIHSQSLIGRDKIPVPTKNSTEDEWKQIFHKLGVPEKKEEYKIENPIKEGQKANEEFFNAYKDKAYELGMLPKQAQAVAEFFNSYVGEAAKKNIDTSKLQYEKEIDDLRKEWGPGYKTNLAYAEEGIRQFASEAEIAVLKKSGILADVAVTKVFAKIGKAIAEDKFDDELIKNDYGLTIEQVKSEMEAMYKPDSPFMLKNHPGHGAAVSRMLKLSGMINGTSPIVGLQNKK